MQLKLLVNQRTLLQLNLNFAILTLLAVAASLSCTTKTDPRESWSPVVYAGDSGDKAIKRAQNSEVIRCEEKRFDEMFCLFDRDMRKLLERCLEEKEARQTWTWFLGEKSREEKEANEQKEISGPNRDNRNKASP